MPDNRIILPVCILILAACAEAPQPVETSNVAATSASIAADVSRDVIRTFDAVSTLETSELARTAISDIGSILGAGDTATGNSGIPGALRIARALEDGGGVDADEASADVAQFLEQRIFAEQNLESSDERSAIFLMRGDVLCTEDCATSCSGDVCTEGCSSAPESECIADIDAMQIRIEAQPIGEHGVNLALMIGPQRHRPLELELRPQSIAAELDLGAAKAAAEHILSVLNEEGELPEHLSGRVRGSIRVIGPDAVAAAVSVLEAIRFEMDLEGEQVSLNVGVAEPLFAIAADPQAGSVSLDIDIAAVDLLLPYAAVSDAQGASGTLGVHVRGTSFSLDLDDNARDIVVTNIGLGDSTSRIAKDGVDLVTLDINANHQRRFDLAIEEFHGSALLTVSPAFELDLVLALAPIANDIEECSYDPVLDLDVCEPAPAFLLNDAFSVSLSGDGAASIRPVTDEGSEGIQVYSGSLTIEAARADSAIVVSEGGCLLGRGDEDPRGDESHELLRFLEAGDCP